MFFKQELFDVYPYQNEMNNTILQVQDPSQLSLKIFLFFKYNIFILKKEPIYIYIPNNTNLILFFFVCFFFVNFKFT